MKSINKEINKEMDLKTYHQIDLQVQNQISDGIRKLIYIKTEDGIKNKVEDEIIEI